MKDAAFMRWGFGTLLGVTSFPAARQLTVYNLGSETNETENIRQPRVGHQAVGRFLQKIKWEIVMREVDPLLQWCCKVSRVVGLGIQGT